ncbi:MAG: hypothetical protein JXJ18_13820 [Rhodobacteraceae bacterium]|nr:hypothetical protein [Paracoccaceae bacterium]
MVTRMTGAIVRAMLVVLLIATPSLLLPDVSRDVTQIVVLLCIFAALLTGFEYSATYPGLVEFRDAPPFNRIRFLSMFLTVLVLTLICRGEFDPTPSSEFARAIGVLIAQAIDFPYSPVRLFSLLLPADAPPALVQLVSISAGMAYLISLLSLALFVIAARVNGWPSRNGAFNVWVNLPTFDPTAGGDVVERLSRDARFNVALGFVLPFVIPVVIKSSTALFDPFSLTNPQTLIWTISAWALLPASLFMRGIAIGRIADMIREQRRRAAPSEGPAFAPA